jgi:carbamoyltransferase
MLNKLHGLYGVKKLCLAGGVAYNCVANGKIFAKTPFELVYIQSAAGDAGLAIGSAFYVWHQVLGRPRSFEMKHSYWGPEFDDEVIGKALRAKGMEAGNFGFGFRLELPDEELCRLTAAKIAEKDCRLVPGRMEWGPRRWKSGIVADPRADMKDILNSRIIPRAFRPFAPSVLAERVGDYFEKLILRFCSWLIRSSRRNDP